MPEFWAQYPACLHASVSLTSSCSPLFSFWLSERAPRRCPTSSAPLSWHIYLVRRRGTPPKPRISQKKFHKKGLCLFLEKNIMKKIGKNQNKRTCPKARDLQLYLGCPEASKAVCETDAQKNPPVYFAEVTHDTSLLDLKTQNTTTVQ